MTKAKKKYMIQWIVIVSAFVAVASILLTVWVINRQTTEKAMNTTVEISTQVETKYSNFKAYADSAEASRQRYRSIMRAMSNALVRRDSKVDELNRELGETEKTLIKERVWYENKINALRDSIRNLERVEYQGSGY